MNVVNKTELVRRVIERIVDHSIKNETKIKTQLVDCF